jgi:hypothetical protein
MQNFVSASFVTRIGICLASQIRGRTLTPIMQALLPRCWFSEHDTGGTR